MKEDEIMPVYINSNGTTATNDYWSWDLSTGSSTATNYVPSYYFSMDNGSISIAAKEKHIDPIVLRRKTIVKKDDLELYPEMTDQIIREQIAKEFVKLLLDEDMITFKAGKVSDDCSTVEVIGELKLYPEEEK